MAEIIGEPLEQLVLVVPARIPGRKTLEFIENARCEPFIDDVVGPMTDDTGPARAFEYGQLLSR